MQKKKVFAICGSTRAQSANLSIIQYVATVLSNEVEFEIYEERMISINADKQWNGSGLGNKVTRLNPVEVFRLVSYETEALLDTPGGFFIMN